jgi:hypothetical protein
MNTPPNSIPPLSRRLVSNDAGGIFAFIRTLRLAVRARVAADHNRGVPFAEIVIHVREMISLSEDSAGQSGERPSTEFRAIAKQADAWCVEAYRGIDDERAPRQPGQFHTRQN